MGLSFTESPNPNRYQMKVTIKILKSIIALALVSYGAYIALNAPTLLKLFKAKFNPVSAEESTSQAIDKATSISYKPQVDQLAQLRSELAKQFKNDWLYYPALNIKAPVEWNVLKSNVHRLMPDSLIHLDGTATPDANGDVLIAGHSSYYWWSKGSYKSVFAPLIRAKEGDDITIRRKDVTYFYKVKKIYQVAGNDGININFGGQNPKVLHLMTCVPIGTSWRRLIVEADLVKAI